MKMERLINQEFEHHGIKYRVREADDKYPYKCVKCGFYDHVCKKCRGTLDLTGDCRIRWRSDRKEVIFEEL